MSKCHKFQDGPDFPDGYDSEGFPGGDDRFGRSSDDEVVTYDDLIETHDQACKARLCETESIDSDIDSLKED